MHKIPSRIILRGGTHYTLSDRRLLDRNLASQAIGARTHAHNVIALAEHVESDRTAHPLKAYNRAPLHIEHVDIGPSSTAHMEQATFLQELHLRHRNSRCNSHNSRRRTRLQLFARRRFYHSLARTRFHTTRTSGDAAGTSSHTARTCNTAGACDRRTRFFGASSQRHSLRSCKASSFIAI